MQMCKSALVMMGAIGGLVITVRALSFRLHTHTHTHTQKGLMTQSAQILQQ